MRCCQRVARSAALFRDRPAGAMRSALVGAALSRRRRAHRGSLNSEPLAETVTCGRVPQFAEFGRCVAAASFDRSLVDTLPGSPGGSRSTGESHEHT
jgi:hypothetical protein